ncbi:hypothetical protein ABT160_23550 [Streptomyces sp. NPDC001941]|uniref:hypothetical protein n=1 Tax=Streptomyces sp. NPDC001941 TaxID=3154659 RepID=UPI00331DA0FE
MSVETGATYSDRRTGKLYSLSPKGTWDDQARTPVARTAWASGAIALPPGAGSSGNSDVKPYALMSFGAVGYPRVLLAVAQVHVEGKQAWNATYCHVAVGLDGEAPTVRANAIREVTAGYIAGNGTDGGSAVSYAMDIPAGKSVQVAANVSLTAVTAAPGPNVNTSRDRTFLTATLYPAR